jgi:hypothetical protein
MDKYDGLLSSFDNVEDYVRSLMESTEAVSS